MRVLHLTGILTKLDSWQLVIVWAKCKSLKTMKLSLHGRKWPNTTVIRDQWRILCFLPTKLISLLHVLFSFSVGSSDKHLQIVDMRSSSSKPEIVVKAHESDINVCDWNAIATHFIVTGSDDCKVKVWDLRKISKKKSQDEFLWFSWHNEPITSVRFQPNEESVIAVASEDNSVSIWDMSVENEEQDP